MFELGHEAEWSSLDGTIDEIVLFPGGGVVYVNAFKLVQVRAYGLFLQAKISSNNHVSHRPILHDNIAGRWKTTTKVTT